VVRLNALFFLLVWHQFGTGKRLSATPRKATAPLLYLQPLGGERIPAALL
jgi:hypothetical protein